MSVYNQFASLYDVLMNDFDYKSWTDYMEEIFSKYNVKPINILEMACGTGNLTYQLALRNYKITCFDISAEMLAKAYQKMGRVSNVKILQQDMIDFKINKSFDSVISICDSINYITSKAKLEKCFINVYDHLKQDGIFIFDINSYYKLKEVIGNNVFVEDRENIFYTWQNYYDESNDISEFYLTFFEMDKNNHYHRFDEEHLEKAYKEDEIIDLLKKVGFRSVDSYEAFTLEKCTDKTQRINFVAIK